MRELPPGYRFVAGGTVFGDCNGTHLADDDGTFGTLCGRIHGGTYNYPPKDERDVCGSCRRVLASRIRKAATDAG